jgi:hypothetical protein
MSRNLSSSSGKAYLLGSARRNYLKTFLLKSKQKPNKFITIVVYSRKMKLFILQSFLKS